MVTSPGLTTHPFPTPGPHAKAVHPSAKGPSKVSVLLCRTLVQHLTWWHRAGRPPAFLSAAVGLPDRRWHRRCLFHLADFQGLQTLMHFFSASTRPLTTAPFSRRNPSASRFCSCLHPTPGDYLNAAQPVGLTVAETGLDGAWKLLCSQLSQPQPHATPWQLRLYTALMGFHQYLHSWVHAVSYSQNPPLVIMPSPRPGIAFPQATPRQKGNLLRGFCCGRRTWLLSQHCIS